MRCADLNRNEIEKLIIYSLCENNPNERNINIKELNKIIDKYFLLCDIMQEKYIYGELDTFKRAACLMNAINQGKLVKRKVENACFSVDVALKMCEKPYYYVGDFCDIPYKLDEVSFDEVFLDEMDTLETYRNLLIDTLIFEKKKEVSLGEALKIELLYQTALVKLGKIIYCNEGNIIVKNNLSEDVNLDKILVKSR